MTVEQQPEPLSASAAREEQAHARSEERFRRLFERAPVGMAELDGEDSCIMAANERFAALVGGSTASLCGRPLLDLVDASEREALGAALAAVRAQPFPRMERELHLATAQAPGASLLFRLTRLDAGSGIVVTVEEPARGRTAGAEAVERRWLETIQSAPVPILILQLADGTARHVNASFQRTYGWTRDATLGRTAGELGMFVEPAQRDAIVDSVKEQGHAELRVLLRRPDGSERLVEDHAMLVMLGSEPCIMSRMVDITEAARAEEALRAREQELLAAFEAAPVGILYGNRSDGKRLAVNQRFADMLGVSKETLLASPATAFTHPEDRHLDQEVLGRMMRGESREERYRKRFIRADGTVGWAEVHATDMPGQSGRFILAVDDVTQKVKQAEELQVRERQWRIAFDRTPVGIAFAAPGEGRWLEVNDRLCEMLGYTREELLSKGILEVTHPDDRQRDAYMISAIGRREIPEARWNKRYLRKDGSTIDCELHVVVLPDHKGTPVRTVSAVLDITDKRQAQAAVQEADARWAATILSLPLGVSLVRMSDGVLIDANPAFERITGYSRAELFGKTANKVNLAEDPEQRRQLIEECSRKGRASISDLRFRTKSGELRIAEVTVSRVALASEPYLVTTLQDVTEERRAEEAIRSREEAVRTMFDRAPVGIAFVSAENSELVGVNERLCQMFGYPREELLKQSILSLTHPDDHATSIARIESLRAEAMHEVQFTKRYVRKDGSLIECDVHSVALPRGPGEVLRHVVGITDVTERRRAQRAAQEAEQRWAATVQAAHVAIVITTLPDLKVVDFNAAAERMTGYTRSELLGRTALELGIYVNPADLVEIIRQLKAQGHSMVSEVPMRRKGGEIRYCDISTAPLMLGGLEGRVSIISDVTERRQIEDALAASEARYRELVEQLEDMILSTDLDGVITFANAAVRRFGYTPADLIGKKAETLLTPEERRKAPGWPKESYSEEELPAPRERMILDKAGQPHPIRHMPRALMRDGKNVGLISIMTDLTAQREVEEQLRAAQRMEAVGRLAGGVAHDFNNLLTVILSYANFARAELPASSPTQAHLEEVVQASKRAEGLTRQLLAFSRKQLMVLEPLSLEKAVGGVTSMLCRLIGEDIHLTVNIPSDLPLVRADRGQLEQVLMNLVINSRDAMPDGGAITIGARRSTLDATVAATLQLSAGDYIELWVQDSGTGMDEATRVRVFEPFFTTKGVGKGTGLGLSTVYGIVKQFGGGITVDSQPGAGTTCRIYLPKGPERAPPEVRREVTFPRSPRGNECVMVVEDDPALRRVVHRLLEHAGYRVVACSTPEEALSTCGTLGASLDLMLTDVVMPGMNGRELGRRVAELIPSARIIYMSGYTDDAIERLDVLNGKFIRKPFSFDEIRRVVREVLDEK